MAVAADALGLTFKALRLRLPPGRFTGATDVSRNRPASDAPLTHAPETSMDMTKTHVDSQQELAQSSIHLRIGSFNVENLFQRARILLLDDQQSTGDELAKVGELQDLLERDDYDVTLPNGAMVRARINELYNALQKFLTIRVDRGATKLFRKPKDAPFELESFIKGRRDWSGSIEFVVDDFSDQTRENTMKVIDAIDADLLCVVEVEGLVALRRLARALSDKFGKSYPYAMSIDGNDERGIDVGLLSRYPITGIETHQFDEDAAGRIFSRDCLVVTVEVPKVGAVTLLCNHLKSLSGDGEKSQLGDMLRGRQVERIKQILAQRDLSRERVVVLGDLNDFEGRARAGADQNFVLDGLVHHPLLMDVVARLILEPALRWTYTGVLRGQRTQSRLDYLLVSAPLAAALGSVTIERRGIEALEQINGEAPFESVSETDHTGASDHAAVVAEFVFEDRGGGA
jgi:endonuclease/exonuclease/phosphatase family metal-dependent hydrolase